MLKPRLLKPAILAGRRAVLDDEGYGVQHFHPSNSRISVAAGTAYDFGPPRLVPASPTPGSRSGRPQPGPSARDLLVGGYYDVDDGNHL